MTDKQVKEEVRYYRIFYRGSVYGVWATSEADAYAQVRKLVGRD